MTQKSKVKVGIIGTGNIGTDLMVKIMRSEWLQCTLFAGRNFDSAGMQKANELGVHISDRWYRRHRTNPDICDTCSMPPPRTRTMSTGPFLDKLGKTVIDMTPAQVWRLVHSCDQCEGSLGRRRT